MSWRICVCLCRAMMCVSVDGGVHSCGHSRSKWSRSTPPAVAGDLLASIYATFPWFRWQRGPEGGHGGAPAPAERCETGGGSETARAGVPHGAASFNQAFRRTRCPRVTVLIGSRAKMTRDDRDSEPYKVTYDIVVRQCCATGKKVAMPIGNDNRQCQ